MCLAQSKGSITVNPELFNNCSSMYFLLGTMLMSEYMKVKQMSVHSPCLPGVRGTDSKHTMHTYSVKLRGVAGRERRMM